MCVRVRCVFVKNKKSEEQRRGDKREDTNENKGKRKKSWASAAGGFANK